LFSGVIGLQAQDKIYKKNKEVIVCKVQKVGVKLIEYTQPDFNEGVVFTIAKDRVEKIVFESGSTMDLVAEYRNPEDYSNQKKSIIKIDFFSPLSGNLTFGYEHSLGIQKSVEMSIGIIGLGTQINENARGVFFRIGYKFIRSPEVYFNAMHYSHILKGFYIRPDFIFSYYSHDVRRNITSPIPGGDVYQTVRSDNFSGAFMINIGKQWIMDDRFSMSWFGGIGYAFSTEAGYYYSHSVPAGNDFPIAFSAGLCFGFLP
jgi:hypothetical protein